MYHHPTRLCLTRAMTHVLLVQYFLPALFEHHLSARVVQFDGPESSGQGTDCPYTIQRFPVLRTGTNSRIGGLRNNSFRQGTDCLYTLLGVYVFLVLVAWGNGDVLSVGDGVRVALVKTHSPFPFARSKQGHPSRHASIIAATVTIVFILDLRTTAIRLSWHDIPLWNLVQDEIQVRRSQTLHVTHESASRSAMPPLRIPPVACTFPALRNGLSSQTCTPGSSNFGSGTDCP